MGGAVVTGGAVGQAAGRAGGAAGQAVEGGAGVAVAQLAAGAAGAAGAEPQVAGATGVDGPVVLTGGDGQLDVDAAGRVGGGGGGGGGQATGVVCGGTAERLTQSSGGSGRGSPTIESGSSAPMVPSWRPVVPPSIHRTERARTVVVGGGVGRCSRMAPPIENHYATLGVGRSASAAAIRAAYLAMARDLHPDRHMSSTPAEQARAERVMRKVNEAWSVLGDTNRKATYDERLEQISPRSVPTSPRSSPTSPRSTPSAPRTSASSATSGRPASDRPPAGHGGRASRYDEDDESDLDDDLDLAEVTPGMAWLARLVPIGLLVGVMFFLLVVTAFAGGGSGSGNGSGSGDGSGVGMNSGTVPVGRRWRSERRIGARRLRAG